jgi:hypothetical protein
MTGRKDRGPRSPKPEGRPPRDARGARPARPVRPAASTPPSTPPSSPPSAPARGVVRVTRILDAPASSVFRALNDPARRGWSPEPLYRVVSALAPRFVRLALPDGSQVSVAIDRQGNVRCSVTVEQSGLPTSLPADVAYGRWKGALAALAEQLDAEWD